VDLALASRTGKVVLISTGNLRLAALREHVAERLQIIHQFLESDERIVAI
jgi:hypothetical protein